MSSPTPSAPDGPSQPSPPYDPWGKPQDGQGASAAPPDDGGPTGPGELRDLARVATLVTVSGVVLGLLWWWLAPSVNYISDGEQAFLRNSEGEETIGVDGVFVLLCAGLGLLSGVVTFLWRRQGGVGLVVGLALGSTLAGLVGWQLGLMLGPSGDLSARAAEVGRGNSFEGPLRLDSTIALLVWPLVALLAHLLLTAAFGPRDPEPMPEEYTGWGAHPQDDPDRPTGYGPTYPGGTPPAPAPPPAHGQPPTGPPAAPWDGHPGTAEPGVDEGRGPRGPY